ncbi:3-hydroxyacyl-CoA dehydrogenase type-2-like isoform X2 [Sitophilus oryzae]|uniref:3-hydroxyacyl-CoA dehydrogenase type-2-like isoform X2 n=1 Tax=Sitophilus oryzae TaxID=7048 RepID=A0A6J2YD87_SITOR|nr:3-hydroxyacyl-CoA dehydrogenase type-2-like isoform X2 [Sitophilus oryzae]
MIKDSVYLVTGGISGLGRGVAEKLLNEGASVAICDLKLPEENDSLRSFVDRVMFFQVDVTSEKEILNALDVIKRKFNKLNGVINCAAVNLQHPVYDFEKHEPHSLQEFTTIINVNLIGTFNVIRLSIPLLIENAPNTNGERGIIVNTSSTLGHQGTTNKVAYAASKAGIIGMTLPLARELSEHGIRVVDIAPGIFNTSTFKHLQEKSNNGKFLGFPKRAGKPAEYGDFVKAVIETPMLNGSSVRLDGAAKI